MKTPLSRFNLSAIRAFTLIELMVVITIIALLTGIIMTNLAPAKGKARDSARVSDVAQIQLALEQYFDRCGQYPPAPLDLTNGTGCPSATPPITLGSYISRIPIPPATGSGSAQYDYATNASGTQIPTDYVLHAHLEYPNETLANSLTQDHLPSWFTGITPPLFPCHVTGSTDTEYCVGAK